MERERFEKLVSRAIAGLPEEFLDKLENVEVMVEDTPNGVQNTLNAGKGLRLGLYEGIPAIQRGTGYNLVAPDKITIFQDAIESIVRSDADIEFKVREVVLHEVAHHFGLDDRRLDEIAAGKRSKTGRS